MSDNSIEDRLKYLEMKVKELEAKLENKKTATRPYKWKHKILETLAITNKPVTKSKLCEIIVNRYGEEIHLTNDEIKYRLSSSYSRLENDKKVLFGKSKYGDEPVIGLYDWFKADDRLNRAIQEWFLKNEDYEYPRIK